MKSKTPKVRLQKRLAMGGKLKQTTKPKTKYKRE